MQRVYKERLAWQTWFADWDNLDVSLLLLVIGLTFFGGLVIQTTEIRDGLSLTDHCWQHWILGLVGVGVALFIARCRYEVLIQWHWLIYGLTNASLLAIMLGFGVDANGSTRWINILGFNVQPSEFAKVGLIITLAALLHARPASTLPAIFRTLAIMSVPWSLVFLQPDLGTSLVFAAIAIGMLYWANAHPAWLVLLVAPVVSALSYGLSKPVWAGWVGLMVLVAWFSLPWRRVGAVLVMVGNLLFGPLGQFVWTRVLEDYQKARLTLFLAPEADPLGGGYHLIQSRIAIGAGQLWGRGPFQGSQTQLDFIPEQHTDFIFSAVGEELGFIGSIVLLIIFWLIALRLIVIAQNAKENFGSLLAIGVLSMIVFQVVINVSMTIGLAPITGLPLPWMSYGRSALLTNFIALGLVESVANHRPRMMNFRR
ncbi:MAG: rod shape-determining protein RodA [Cyanobacteria bacterium P01_G01_bin.54]